MYPGDYNNNFDVFRSPTNGYRHSKVTAKSPTNNGRNAFANFIPARVESRMTSTASGNNGHSRSTNTGTSTMDNSNMPPANNIGKYNGFQAGVVTPKNDKKNKVQIRQAFNRNTFAAPVTDPDMGTEFDFEKNLALFDKQAIWDEIEQKPDVVRQTGHVKKKNYRHDENILDSRPVGLRQIKTNYQSGQEYVTDDGIVIPCISLELRSRIMMQAELVGLTWERQSDMLARGAVELAMQLLGGARRLCVKNQHQWPKITIICDELFRNRHSDIGFSAGRQMAAQGLSVQAFLPQRQNKTETSREMDLFKMTSNLVTYTTSGNYIETFIVFNQSLIHFYSIYYSFGVQRFGHLGHTKYTCATCIEMDIGEQVIFSHAADIFSVPVTNALLFMFNRSPVLAIDPPAAGIDGINIKCSILPLLPFEDIQLCGKPYLCNLSIPDSIICDAGIKYKSPFGNKFIIPLHMMTENDE